MARMSIVWFIYLFILIAIPALVGVYVYRDAVKRGMNAVVWTLIAVLVPSLIGFIIYLIVRSSYSNLNCPGCGANVKEQYVVCPRCGAKLKASCQNCGSPVERDWKVCPHCAGELPGRYEDVKAPIQKKDRTLGIILLAVVVIPIFLLIIGFAGFTSVKSGGSSSIMGCYTPDEYLTEYENQDAVSESHKEDIAQWFDTCRKNTKEAYALRYTTEQGDEKITEFLVYLPMSGTDTAMASSSESGYWKDTMKVRYTMNPDSDADGIAGYQLAAITYKANRFANVEVCMGNQKVKCNVTNVEYPVFLTEE